MASLPTGSDELVYIQTEKIRVTIKGRISDRYRQKSSDYKKESAFRVFCDEQFIADLRGETMIVDPAPGGRVFLCEVQTQPIFFEQQNYQIIIESLSDETVTFWHDNYNIRNKITPVGRNQQILSGVINFGNEIGMSDFVIRFNGKDYLRIVLEVFPSKISYKEDYQEIVADVTAEVYNMIFDVLRKTYLSYRQGEMVNSSPAEFFAVIRQIYDDFLRSANQILAHPHHELETIYSVLPSHKIKQTDCKSIQWIEKHPNQARKSDGRIRVARALAVQKQVTYNTKENRFTKYILESTSKKLLDFKKSYCRLQRYEDSEILREIDSMIRGINRLCNSGILSHVSAVEGTSGMSLVFFMAPGYRDLYRYYLMLLRGLSVTGDIFNISVKDLAVLYEYWSFIKLNSLLKERYELVSQNIVKVQGNGLYVSLVKGKASQVTYRNPVTGEILTLSYNPKEVKVPTVTQRPDNVLMLEKLGTDVRYEYVFDSKYKINPALPGTDYYSSISHYPGPEIDDINTMHRYRDAIVYKNGASPFERTMFGAYVLFPYNNEEEYQNHRFYKSIDEVNIGGLPFLPSATNMVSELLDELVGESPESAFERTTLPCGIEEKLVKMDWTKRDVLVGTLSSKEQLDACLKYNFYHTPVAKVPDQNFPIRYIAIYQSKRKFGTEAGIRYYGEVTKCIPVPRNEIIEIPSNKTNMYYRFEVREWKQLTKPIAAKEIPQIISFTNRFLLEHSSEMPELLIRSEEEFRLFSELKRAVYDTSINDEDNKLGFSFGEFFIYFEDCKIFVSKGSHTYTQYDVNVFVRKPYALLRNMEKDLERLAQ